LEFFKIDGVGLIDDTTVPGTWASDQLIANNNSWTVTIPSDIAPGNYVLRHEIIALHSAGTVDGAQNYPQCVNIQVSGTGTATPAGVLGTALYTETDPGIEINIYESLSTYVVPGPTLYSGAVSISQTVGGSATAIASVSTGAVTSVASSSSPVITSIASSADSSAAGAITTIATPSSGFSYFSNSTMNSTATSTKKSKSACKVKTTSTSLAVLATSSNDIAAASVTIPTTSPGVIVATSQATSSIEVVKTATVSPIAVSTSSAQVAASSTSSAPTSSETSSGVTEPKGTTLGDLLSWISDFYNKHAGTKYSESTVARRHPRALRV